MCFVVLSPGYWRISCIGALGCEINNASKSTNKRNTDWQCLLSSCRNTVFGPSPPPFLSVEAFQYSNALLHYYTGLETFEKFEAVFRSLGPAVDHLRYLRTDTVTTISPMNQVLLMLAKLRQDVDYLPWSRMCNISVFTVETVFLTWINFCSRQWGEVDMCLSQEPVRYFAPSDFKAKLPSTRVVLDESEVSTEKPSNPASQSIHTKVNLFNSWPHTKHLSLTLKVS